MALDENLSRLIGKIYESVYEEAAWCSVIRSIMQRTRSEIALASLIDFKARHLDKFEFFAPETSSVATGSSEYGDGLEHEDFSLRWAVANPHAGLVDSHRSCPSPDYLKDPFIRWNRARFGTSHWQVFYRPPQDDLSFALSLHRTELEGPASREETAVHGILFDHIERAMRIAARPPNFERREDALIALNRVGRVLALSGAAEAIVSQGDGISIESGYLKIEDSTARAWLADAIKTGSEAIETHRGPGGVSIPRPSGHRPLFAIVSRLPKAVSHLPIDNAEHVVRIVANDACFELPVGISKSLKITPAERLVAELLMQGHSLESLSERLTISRNTARVHLQSLFRKTGTNRQTDLVRMLMELSRR